MKRLLTILFLSGSLILTGCGDSKNDYTQVSGQQSPPVVNPTPTPPVGTPGYFVDAINGNDATAAAAANPTDQTPFNTIQAAVTDAPDNTTITVRAGNYAEIVTLKNGQRLIGTPGGTRPALTGRIILADGNTVDFMRIQDAPDDAIDGDNRNGGTITNCEIVNSAARGVSVVPGTGTWVVTGNTIIGSEGIGVRLDTDGTGQMRAQVNDNTINGSTLGAIGLLAGTNSQQVIQLNGNIMANNLNMATVETISGTTATLSLDIEDNTNDDVYSFARATTAFLNVEQLGQLIPINNNSGTVDIVISPVSIAPDDVADGFCGF